jgi:hypothetical protein
MPLEQLDNCAFMIGKAGTCYQRGKAGWKETLLLSLARGGNIHMTLGNLENLTDEDATWFAQAQEVYAHFPSPKMVGGEPGQGQAYGYLASNGSRQILTAVNPSLSRQTLETPSGLDLAFSDRPISGYKGVLELGPGGMAVLTNFDPQLEIGQRLKSPLPSMAESSLFRGEERFLFPIATDWRTQALTAEASFTMPSDGDLHIVVTQQDARGKAVRTSGGSPPDGRTNSQLLKLVLSRNGQAIEVQRPEDKAVWSGLSWAYGIVKGLKQGDRIEVFFETSDIRVATLKPQAFALNRRK